MKKILQTITLLAAVLIAAVMFTGCATLFGGAKDDGGIVPAQFRGKWFYFNAAHNADQRFYNEDLYLVELTADGVITRTPTHFAGNRTENRGLIAGTGYDYDMRVIPDDSGVGMRTAQITSFVPNTGRKERNMTFFKVTYVFQDIEYKLDMRFNKDTGRAGFGNAAENDPFFYVLIKFNHDLFHDNPEFLALTTERNMSNQLAGIWYDSQEKANTNKVNALSTPNELDAAFKEVGGFAFYISASSNLFDLMRSRKGVLTMDYRNRSFYIGSAASVSAKYTLEGSTLTITESTVAGIRNGVYYRAEESAPINEGVNLLRLFGGR